MTKATQGVVSRRQAGEKASVSRGAAHSAISKSEVVVTDEMIAAGVSVLNSHVSDDHRVLPDESIVEKIFSEMDKYRHLSAD